MWNVNHLEMHYLLKVADLDDEFAELVLGKFSESFDSLPADEVCALTHSSCKLDFIYENIPVLKKKATRVWSIELVIAHS